ncbi:hypothetical protein MHYP_G00363560 [Metynnis hypsauchen]
MNETLNLENQEESRKQDGLVLSETSRLDLPDDVGEISRPTRDVQNSAKIPKTEVSRLRSYSRALHCSRAGIRLHTHHDVLSDVLNGWIYWQNSVFSAAVVKEIQQLVMVQFTMSLQQPNFRKVFIFVLGEKDHLIPSTSHFLSESDFSVAAGRMMGHSFLNGGPCLGGPPEEATTDIKDCADLDIREKIQLLEGTTQLSAEEKHVIHELALSWGFPLVTSESRRRLFDHLLVHARLYFLRILRKSNLQEQLLVSCYRSTTSSRCLSRAANILKDTFHPGHHLFDLLPSDHRPTDCSRNTAEQFL